MRPKSFLDALHGLFLACLLGLIPGQVSAKVLTCYNCDMSGYAGTARSAGTGDHLVLDYGRGQITRWTVYYDRELATWMAEPAEIEAWMVDAFEDVAEATKLLGTSRLQVDVSIRPDEPIFEALIPDQFREASAFDFTLNRTNRGQLANALGGGLLTTSPDSKYSTPARAAIMLVSGLLKGASAFIPDPEIRIVIIWRDGSKTRFRITSTTPVDKPEYQLGQSRDSDGNPIPDETVVPGTASSCVECFVGDFRLSGENVIRWLDVARGFGVRIEGSSSGQTETWRCEWNGDALICHRIR